MAMQRLITTSLTCVSQPSRLPKPAALQHTCNIDVRHAFTESRTTGLSHRTRSYVQSNDGSRKLKTSLSSKSKFRQQTILQRQYHTGRRTQQYFSPIGAEPGIDGASHGPTIERHGSSLDVEADIRVIDYSDSRVAEQTVTPDALDALLREEAVPKWATCRWINVNGLNLDVIKHLGRHKGLHRLAIEDVLDTRTPTKVDWYDNHCFMVLPFQKLVRLKDHSACVVAEQESDNPLWLSINDPGNPGHDSHHERRHRWRTLAHESLGMSIEQVSIFLTTDNTVITVFERSGHDVLKPILERLESESSVVRTSKDPSMLVQAVIDAIVDLSMPISKAAADTFGELEVAVLRSPSIAQSKHLYILRSGLTHFMDNLISTGGLIRTICDHHGMDPTPDKTDDHDPVASNSHNKAASGSGRDAKPVPSAAIKVSLMTRVYLSDVKDHLLSLQTSTRESIRAAENLTNLIFNTIAASQNESVRKLTLLSSFFLPLTFLTGYFGMNFDPMPIVNENSDAVFWWIATPVMVIAVLFLGPKPRWARSFGGRRRRRLGAGRFDPNQKL